MRNDEGSSSYCPKQHGHGVEKCGECQRLGDDCSGDDEE